MYDPLREPQYWEQFVEREQEYWQTVDMSVVAKQREAEKDAAFFAAVLRDYKTMFIAQDLRDEADKMRWKSAFEKNPTYGATDKKEADRLMEERRNLLTSANLDYLI